LIIELVRHLAGCFCIAGTLLRSQSKPGSLVSWALIRQETLVAQINCCEVRASEFKFIWAHAYSLCTELDLAHSERKGFGEVSHAVPSYAQPPSPQAMQFLNPADF
jgi:hypothetical protein